MKKISKRILALSLTIVLVISSTIIAFPANKNVLSFGEWRSSGITATNASVSNVTSTGFTLSSYSDAIEGMAPSPTFSVVPGASYKISIDITGDNWDVYIFFLDSNDHFVNLSDITNRFSSNGSGVSSRTFVAPAGSVKARIRCDANGSNNSVRFDNINVWEIVVTEQFPSGYNFEDDSFSFRNYSASLDYEYYETMFNSGKGFTLWKETRNAGGQCFGMAYATASLYNGLPACESIRSLKNAGGDFINISSGIKINNHSLSIRDFIAYSYIYQFSTNVVDGSVWTNGSTIYDLVKEYTNDNRIGVTIGMTRKDETGGHRVLAIGIDGNDILIDDPNNTADYERITVREDGSWTFSGLSDWNSETCYIRYNLDYHMPYKILSTGTTVEVSDGFIDDKTSEKNSFVKDMDVIDDDLLLLSVDCDDYNIANSNVSKIIIDAVDKENTGLKTDLYWIKDAKSVSVTGINGSENEISVSGNNSILEVKTNDSSDINITMDEENEVSALINTTNGNTYTVSQTSFDIDDNALNISITGTANGNEVIATETDNGIQVSGINDITVTCETADGTVETKADVKDGSTVNITVNDDENTVETDWQCKHADIDHDGICDSCGDDFTVDCSHMCHKSGFVGFFWKIINFIQKLFGVKSAQYCDCGKAHW